MSKSLVVRYRTKPECAEENARLIRDVFAELAADPTGRAQLPGLPAR